MHKMTKHKQIKHVFGSVKYIDVSLWSYRPLEVVPVFSSHPFCIKKKWPDKRGLASLKVAV